MKISPEKAAGIANLARLAPSEEKLELFARQFEDILTHMDQLNEVDTTDVEPLYSPVTHGTVFREDVAEKRFAREEILANAPEDDEQYFVVPRIV